MTTEFILEYGQAVSSGNIVPGVFGKISASGRQKEEIEMVGVHGGIYSLAAVSAIRVDEPTTELLCVFHSRPYRCSHLGLEQMMCKSMGSCLVHVLIGRSISNKSRATSRRLPSAG